MELILTFLISFTVGFGTHWYVDKPEIIVKNECAKIQELQDTSSSIEVETCFEFENAPVCTKGNPRYVFSIDEVDTIRGELETRKYNIDRCFEVIRIYNESIDKQKEVIN